MICKTTAFKKQKKHGGQTGVFFISPIQWPIWLDKRPQKRAMAVFRDRQGREGWETGDTKTIDWGLQITLRLL